MSEKVRYESLCPRCKTLGYHFFIEHVPGVFDIPPRDMLRCAECGQVFYRKVVNGENAG